MSSGPHLRGRGGRDGGGGRGGGGRGGGRDGGGRGAGDEAATLRELALRLRGMQLAAPRAEAKGERAVRPGPGGMGRLTVVWANYYKLEVNLQQAHHYDVVITPVIEGKAMEQRNRNPGKGLCRRILRELAAAHAWPVGWAFDGEKSLFAPTRMFGQPGLVYEHQLQVGDDTRAFQVEMRWANTIDMRRMRDFFNNPRGEVPRECLQALEVALKHGVASRLSAMLTPRAVFLDPEDVCSIGGGLEIWYGYKQALKPCQLGLALNVDTAVATCVEGRPCHELMAEALECRNLNALQQYLAASPTGARRRLQKFLRGLRVSSSHINGQARRYRIWDVSQLSAADYTFEVVENGVRRRTTIVQFMWQTHQKRLAFPWLPVVRVHETKPNFLPPELLMVVRGQQRRGKLTANQQAQMVSMTKQQPADKRATIDKIALQQANFPADDTVRAWGLKFPTAGMTRTEARQLPPPVLHYKHPAALDVGSGGSWNLRAVKLYATPPLQSWGVASLVPSRELDHDGAGGLPRFLEVMVRMLNDMGLQGAQMPPVAYPQGRALDIGAVLRAAHAQAQATFKLPPQLLLVVLPEKNADLYREAKKVSDSELGLPSQCVVRRAAGLDRMGPKNESARMQYIANVIMKMNVKIGGTNAALRSPPGTVPSAPTAMSLDSFLPSARGKPFIVFGCDVAHPTSFDANEPSVAGIVASCNRTMTRFMTRVLVQAGRTELVANLHVPIRELLMDFYIATKKKPEAIIFFRDGVSEGEYEQVRVTEYNAIRQACLELHESYTPPITFITVQKRHNTRLLPVAERPPGVTTPTDRSGNVAPGIVVDKDIAHPRDFDFYLNSHASLQGTSRPAHYNVLVDENGFSADGVQMLSYWLCYLMCRCTRAVSYPSITYYAHLAAARGKLLTEHSDSSSEASGASGASQAFARIHAALNNTMFYV